MSSNVCPSPVSCNDSIIIESERQSAKKINLFKAEERNGILKIICVFLNILFHIQIGRKQNDINIFLVCFLFSLTQFYPLEEKKNLPQNIFDWLHPMSTLLSNTLIQTIGGNEETALTIKATNSKCDEND